MKIIGGFFYSAIIIVLMAVLWPFANWLVATLEKHFEFRSAAEKNGLYLFGMILNSVGSLFILLEIGALIHGWPIMSRGLLLCYAAIAVLIFFGLMVYRITSIERDHGSAYNHR